MIGFIVRFIDGYCSAQNGMLFASLPIKQIRRDCIVRNMLIAIGNSGDLSLCTAVARLISHPNPMAAEAAAWANAHLESSL